GDPLRLAEKELHVGAGFVGAAHERLDDLDHRLDVLLHERAIPGLEPWLKVLDGGSSNHGLVASPFTEVRSAPSAEPERAQTRHLAVHATKCVYRALDGLLPGERLVREQFSGRVEKKVEGARGERPDDGVYIGEVAIDRR